MRKFSWIVGALFIVAMLIIAEITIVSNASGYEAKDVAVFAKQKIEENTVVTVEMLEMKEISKTAVHPNAFKAVNEAVAMTSKMVIEPGEQLLKSKLTSDIRDVIMAENSNNRLITMELKVEQANAWQFSDDQYVDIIYVPNHGEGQEQPPEAAGVSKAVPFSSGVRIMEGIRVAGLINEDGIQVKPKDSADRDPDNIPKYASFEVTQEQAVFLAYAKSNGKLELSCIPDK